MFSFLAAMMYGSILIEPLQVPQEPASQLPDVVVDGRTIEDLARDFIDVVADPPRGYNQARWNGEVCIGVVNLRRETGQFLADRVAEAAVDVGLEPGRPGCSANVVILATTDGQAAARELVERWRGTLSRQRIGVSASRAALQRFQDSDRPVRWWHISLPVDPDSGQQAIRLQGDLSFGETQLERVDELPQVSAIPTLLASPTRQDLRRAIVIIDFNRLGDVDFDQLADYVAFVALAQVDPEGDTSAFPTILNVFDDPAATPRLTDWDHAYLQGLYRSDDSARGSSAREAALRREMLRAREDQGAPPEAE